MAIKFPQSIDEYTGGELWYSGIDESVARRILFSLNTVEDPEEMFLRKLYLAHWYSEREDYKLAVNLCRQLILEEGPDRELLTLMQYCSARAGDISAFTEVLGTAKYLDEDERNAFMENFNTEEFPAEVIFAETGRAPGVKVEHKDGWVEYSKNGKPVFKYFDNDYYAFVKDNAARKLLSVGDALGAIAQLDAIKLRHVKSSTILLCNQTYILAFLELKEYLNAYSHCKIFMEKNLYMDAMLILMEGLKDGGYVSQFEELRSYLANRSGYEIYQMERFFDYSDTTGDYGFWEKVQARNPLVKMKETDERLCLEGRAYERASDEESAKKCWRKAISLYGQFSGAKYYFTYPELFEEAKSKQIAVLPTLSDSDGFSLTQLCKKAAIEQLNDFKTADGKLKNPQKTASLLNIALTKLYLDIGMLSESVKDIYGSAYLPFVSEIDRLAVGEEVDDVNRAICLANFTLYCKKKDIIWKGEKHRNIIADIKGKEFNVKYGVAMFAAHVMISLRAEGKNVAKVHSEIKKFYSMIEWEKYPNIRPYAVYAFLLEYYANIRLAQKRIPNYGQDLQEFIRAMEDNRESEQTQKNAKLFDAMLARLKVIDKQINSDKDRT